MKIQEQKTKVSNMSWNRRDFLKTGGLATLSLGLNAFGPSSLRRLALAGQGATNKKMVFIFQRGGNDGVNTVIPRGDPEYNNTNRPTLFIDEVDAIDSGNGFAQLNPMFQPLMEFYNGAAINGVAGPGQVAFIHRVGYSGQSQSHFDSQNYWETGVINPEYLTKGALYGVVAETMDPVNNPLSAVSLSNSQMLALKGPLALPTFSNPANFKFAGSQAKVDKFTGLLPTTPEGANGKGFLGFYGGPQDALAHAGYWDLVSGTGTVLARAMQIVQDAIALGTYTPANGAAYPSGDLGPKLMNAAMLMKRIPELNVVTINHGGHDTHTNQGGPYGYHGKLIANIAGAIAAFLKDMGTEPDLPTVVTGTEFGRTSIENGSQGTDHAYASVVIVAGGGVKGGVYNCDPSKWLAGDLFSQSTRYLKRASDFRSVFGEVIKKKFGFTDATLDQKIIPGYLAAKTANPTDFASLGIMA